jgi:hypothetical protein
VKKELLRTLALVCLSVCIILLYIPVRNFEFLNFDDDLYITQNSLVLQGLSGHTALQAFQQSLAGHYHPLTWLSHMLDTSLFGMNPGAFHLENVLFHALNTGLCFILFASIFSSWQKAFVLAALFGVHPMRIESVAWLSERKDLLSMSLGLTTIISYVRWKLSTKGIWLAASLLCFILSLLAKPTFLTMPALLLLIDGLRGERITWKSILDKIPYGILSCLMAWLVMHTQNADGGLKSLEVVSLSNRLSSACVGYLTYAGKFFFPFGIGIFYPFRIIDPSIAIGAAVILLILTGSAYYVRKHTPEIWLGWIWFIVSLLPMIGLIQIGGQSYADRWSYLSHIGILIACITFFSRYKFFSSKYFWILPTLYFASLTWWNLPFWKDSISIFSHTLEVSPDNFMAHTNLGNALDAAGNLTDATPHFEAAWKLNPLYPEALNNYGRVKASQNNFSEAHALFQKAVEIKPSFIIARYNLGLTHFELGRIVDSAHEWLLVLEQQPHNQQAMQSLQFIHQHNLGQLCDQLMHSGTTAYNDFQQLWLKHLPEHPIPCFS